MLATQFKGANVIPGWKDQITRIDSPRVLAETKSKDFDVSSVRSPVASRRGERVEVNLQKSVFDLHTADWILKYDIINKDFAKGAYGKIWLARDKQTNEPVVIKQIPRNTPIRMINNEVKAGRAIGNHSNIAGFIQYVEKSDFHYIVFQYVQGQDLFSYLEHVEFTPRPDSEARSIITQISKALEHIHQQKIAHRDVKLENILVDQQGTIYVIDLGLCAFIQEGTLCKDWCGSDNYLAPEIVRRIPYDGYKADVFSAGVVLFALLYGVFPFENLRVHGAQSIDSLRPLKTLKVRFPTDVAVAKEAQDLISRMLEDDPHKRITIAEVLKHEWMVGSGQQDMDMEIDSMMMESCESRHMN